MGSKRVAILRAICSVMLVVGCASMLVSCGSQAANTADSTSADASTIEVSLRIDGTEGDHGIIYDGTVSVPEESSVYDALVASGVDMKSKSSSGMSAYVSEIDGLAEREGGPTSGWLYAVNGEAGTTSCDKVFLHDGDAVEWAWKKDGLSGM